MEPRQLRRMARRARRRAHDGSWTMRTVTARAWDGLAMPVRGFVCVTTRAARRRVFRFVRLVATGTVLMPDGCRRCFHAMARRTRCRRRGRRMRRRAMARSAVGVTGVGRRAHAIRVTPRAHRRVRDGDRAVRRVAERACGVAGARRRSRSIAVATPTERRVVRWLAGVCDVTVEARRARVGLKGVARRAGDRSCSCCERPRVDRMTADARAVGRDGVADHPCVARRARVRCVVVW